MRRLFSISAIAALMLQLVSPLLAAACPHTKQMPACHRTQQQAAQSAQHHHCDAMMEQDQTEPVALDSETPSVKAVDSSGNCPMDCCGASVVTNAAAVAASTPLPSLVATEQSCRFVPVTFTSAGFSSHTDRGPPAA